jgi:osmoprotectant transport system permease protein
MTFWQRLRWVEIPMALPVIFGGIRTAVVMNIGVMAMRRSLAQAAWGYCCSMVSAAAISAC